MLALLLAASAFNAPMGSSMGVSRVVASPVISPEMVSRNERKGAFWQRDDWIASSNAASAERASAAPAAPAAAAAPSGEMTVPQACVFMEDASVAGVSFEEKKAFLMSKGVSEFVVAGAACTAPDATLVL